MEAFAFKWFFIYYFALSALFTIQGIIWLIQPSSITEKTRGLIQQTTAPKQPIRIIKYLLLFSLASFAVSFFPLNWVNLLYSLWGLTMVYIAGRFFLKWEDFCAFWESHETGLERFFQRTGAFFLGIGIATFLILYYTASTYL